MLLSQPSRWAVSSSMPSHSASPTTFFFGATPHALSSRNDGSPPAIMISSSSSISGSSPEDPSLEGADSLALAGLLHKLSSRNDGSPPAIISSSSSSISGSSPEDPSLEGTGCLALSGLLHKLSSRKDGSPPAIMSSSSSSISGSSPEDPSVADSLAPALILSRVERKSAEGAEENAPPLDPVSLAEAEAGCRATAASSRRRSKTVVVARTDSIMGPAIQDSQSARDAHSASATYCPLGPRSSEALMAPLGALHAASNASSHGCGTTSVVCEITVPVADMLVDARTLRVCWHGSLPRPHSGVDLGNGEALLSNVPKALLEWCCKAPDCANAPTTLQDQTRPGRSTASSKTTAAIKGNKKHLRDNRK
mmetsp:Transcript_3926/g.9541  ORF Transcript_3926/g.9541 Transcript_3926/m.9541 type:complete len:366 (+) Transcript_3926:52-1149(+)